MFVQVVRDAGGMLQADRAVEPLFFEQQAKRPVRLVAGDGVGGNDGDVHVHVPRQGGETADA